MTGMAEWRDLPTQLDGLNLLHQMRHGGDVPVLLVHGIGPGTTGCANFRPLLNTLGPRFALHVIDLAGFGGSDCKLEPPFFDVQLWLAQIDQAIERIRQIRGRAPILIGNSVGGTLALKTAARRTDITQVVAISASAGPPASLYLRAFWTAPRDADGLVAAMQPMTAFEAAPDPALVQARMGQFLKGSYAEYYNAMLADPDECLREAALTQEEAAMLRADVTLVHGRLDRACPMPSRLADLLPDADVFLIGNCGHNVIYEHTARVLDAIRGAVNRTLPL